jgi:hypothetical protein
MDMFYSVKYFLAFQKFLSKPGKHKKLFRHYQLAETKALIISFVKTASLTATTGARWKLSMFVQKKKKKIQSKEMLLGNVFFAFSSANIPPMGTIQTKM